MRIWTSKRTRGSFIPRVCTRMTRCMNLIAAALSPVLTCGAHTNSSIRAFACERTFHGLRLLRFTDLYIYSSIYTHYYITWGVQLTGTGTATRTPSGNTAPPPSRYQCSRRSAVPQGSPETGPRLSQTRCQRFDAHAQYIQQMGHARCVRASVLKFDLHTAK